MISYEKKNLIDENKMDIGRKHNVIIKFKQC